MYLNISKRTKLNIIHKKYSGRQILLINKTIVSIVFVATTTTCPNGSQIIIQLNLAWVLATSELRKRPGKSEVDNASWDCFRGRKQKARPQKQSRDALSTSLLPGLLRNSEVANTTTTTKTLYSKTLPKVYQLFSVLV